MSDEEKKAIESLIEIREFANLSSYKDTKINQLNAIDTILNLIEKQSKEIEELKEKNEFLNWYFENQKENFIHKDKIKAKIEEKFLEAKGLYERGVQPQAQYTMKLLRDLEKSLLEKE